MLLNFKQISLYTGGRYITEPIDPSEILTGITWDSRYVNKGDLYVALPGEKTDGHKYVEDAIKAGARGVLVNDVPAAHACVIARELGVGIIEVPNTFAAIEDLAREWRGHLNATVIGVTGSVGKTTTKNLVRDVCSAGFKTVATEANQNNELGVPNTILRCGPDTEVAVVEMGMRGLGQISSLCKIAHPAWGLITNVGEAHMELLGTKDNIARAKGELFANLPAGEGKAFVPASDDYADFLVTETLLPENGVEVYYFGEGASAREGSPRVWPEDVELDAEGRAVFTICAQGFIDDADAGDPTLFNMEPDVLRAKCHLSVRGLHNVSNACSAASVGLALGMPIDVVSAALSESVPETGRLEILSGRDGYRVINDAYNANPDSMRAALSMLASMDVSGRRIAVLGDMGELGDAEVACHKAVGEAAANAGIDLLICVGQLAEHIAEGAKEAGMDQLQVLHVNGIGGALGELESSLGHDDVVLVKGSHFMRLERVVEGLVS